jgi:GR25 family glycosyltransferase involved in LPS biosynthesis
MSIYNIPIYIVSYKNKERKERMIKRFSSLHFNNINFVNEVHSNDDRITCFSHLENYYKIEKRTWSIMLQHLDSIKDFYENADYIDYNHCIICEDDIFISKDLGNKLNGIIEDFDSLSLDILMLGYLLPFKIDTNSSYHLENFPLLSTTEKNENSYTIHKYPDDIWGTQMYMISREYAKFILEKFTNLYAYYNLDKPYNPDWVITKNGNRALISPMLAVEEGDNLSECDSQKVYHKLCFETHYDSEIYI